MSHREFSSSNQPKSKSPASQIINSSGQKGVSRKLEKNVSPEAGKTAAGPIKSF
jgi:hypothetical protein